MTYDNMSYFSKIRSLMIEIFHNQCAKLPNDKSEEILFLFFCFLFFEELGGGDDSVDTYRPNNK